MRHIPVHVYVEHGLVRKAARMDWQQLQGLDGLAAGCAEVFGVALPLAQAGDQHEAAKVLKGFGGAGVLEVVEDDSGGPYRAVYTVKFAEAVFVLHCFQKKSRRGIEAPKEDMNIIRARLKLAEALAKEQRNEKAPG